MITYPDTGYSPDNFKALVEATGMKKIKFITYFDVTKAMFYRYQNGDTTMQYSDWVALQDLVESYIQNPCS